MLLLFLYFIHFWYFDGMTVTFLVYFFVVQWTSSLQHLLREISIAHLWHLLEGCFEEKNRAHVRNITLLSLTCTSYYKTNISNPVPYIIFMKKVNHSSITPRWKLENPNNVSAVVAWHLNILTYSGIKTKYFQFMPWTYIQGRGHSHFEWRRWSIIVV